jgi:hypothetical protein
VRHTARDRGSRVSVKDGPAGSVSGPTAASHGRDGGRAVESSLTSARSFPAMLDGAGQAVAEVNAFEESPDIRGQGGR